MGAPSSDPSIIKVYDEGTFTVGDRETRKPVREYPFAVVDYMPTNLEAKLGWGPPKITRLEAVRHIFNIASGVAYLHSQPQPILHRDIKPSNILVSGHDARLGDLGLARVLMGDAGERVGPHKVYRDAAVLPNTRTCPDRPR